MPTDTKYREKSVQTEAGQKTMKIFSKDKVINKLK